MTYKEKRVAELLEAPRMIYSTSNNRINRLNGLKMLRSMLRLILMYKRSYLLLLKPTKKVRLQDLLMKQPLQLISHKKWDT